MRDIETRVRHESPNVCRGEARDIHAAQSELGSQRQLSEHRIPSSQNTELQSSYNKSNSTLLRNAGSSYKEALRRIALNSSQDTINNISQHTSRNELLISQRREHVTSKTDMMGQAHVNAPKSTAETNVICSWLSEGSLQQITSIEPRFPA